nr:MAG TPA: hypothetical protein [Caudoviricetes sp.]
MFGRVGLCTARPYFFTYFLEKALTIYQSWYIIKTWKGEKNK